MPRSTTARRLAATLVAALGLTGAVATLSPLEADAATTQTATCVDGGGTRWTSRVVWGSTYPGADGTTRVSASSAGWTTDARAVATDSQVRTYDGAGRLLQTLRRTATSDYHLGGGYASRNPVNPPSAPGRARIKVTTGVSGDGFGSCTATFTQPAASAGSASPTPTVSVSDRYEADVVTATNGQRSAAALAKVSPQACVDSYAEAQAKRMASQSLMYHQDLGQILQSCDLTAVGENVAYGYADGTKVTAGWMASPGHRANILTASYRLIGVGAAQNAAGVWYVAQVFGTA